MQIKIESKAFVKPKVDFTKPFENRVSQRMAHRVFEQLWNMGLVSDKSNWAPSTTTIRFYRPTRRFNLCFSVEDLQGDGYVRFTLIVFKRAMQLVIPFVNRRRVFFEFQLFPWNRKMRFGRDKQ